MQPIGTVRKKLVGDHQGIISVVFGHNSISSLETEVVRNVPYIIQCKIVTGGQFLPQGHNLNREDQLHFENLFLTAVT